MKSNLLSIKSFFSEAKNVYIFSGIFFVIAALLQWLFQIEQLRSIIGSLNGIFDILDFFADSFLNLFRFIDDWTPISFLLISLFQSLSIGMYLEIRSKRKLKSNTASSLSLGLLGSSCVACSGSLFTPLLSILGVNVTATSLQFIGDVVLLAAVVVSYIVFNRVAQQYVNYKQLV